MHSYQFKNAGKVIRINEAYEFGCIKYLLIAVGVLFLWLFFQESHNPEYQKLFLLSCICFGSSFLPNLFKHTHTFDIINSKFITTKFGLLKTEFLFHDLKFKISIAAIGNPHYGKGHFHPVRALSYEFRNGSPVIIFRDYDHKEMNTVYNALIHHESINLYTEKELTTS